MLYDKNLDEYAVEEPAKNGAPIPSSRELWATKGGDVRGLS